MNQDTDTDTDFLLVVVRLAFHSSMPACQSYFYKKNMYEKSAYTMSCSKTLSINLIPSKTRIADLSLYLQEFQSNQLHTCSHVLKCYSNG